VRCVILLIFRLEVVALRLRYIHANLCLFFMLICCGSFYSGWIVSTSLAGATVGSFTGGALADKFGRTRTFIMDSIPLAIGAFLRLINRN
jgi:MFS family permease